MNTKKFYGFVLGFVLLSGSIPLSFSADEFSDTSTVVVSDSTNVQSFSESTRVSITSSTAVEPTIKNEIIKVPRPTSDDDRKKKFDDGFYEKISDLLKEKPSTGMTCPTDSPYIDFSNVNMSNGCTQVSSLDQENDYYDIIIMVQKIQEDGLDRKSVAKLNKDRLELVLTKVHGVEEYYKGKVLSFVTAKVPITEISRLADYGFVGRIGDGQQKMELELDDSKETIDSLNLSISGDGILVAIFDVGIRQDHDDLPIGTKIVDQMVCNDSACPTSSQDFGDTSDHGTHVAGIIAGLGNIDSDLSGVAVDSDLLNVKLSGTSTGFGMALDESVSRGADVINVSLGFGQCSQNIINDMIDETWDIGVVVVKSAGNEGDDPHTITNPGCGYNVLATGNLDDNNTGHISTDDTIWSTSSRGPTNVTSSDPGRLKPEIAAPGTNIDSPDQTQNYDEETGTSFAAPHVSGTTALIKEQNSYYNPLEIKAALLLGADWQGTSIPNNALSYDFGLDSTTLNAYGFGVLDVASSLTYAGSGNNIIHDTIAFGSTTSKEYTFTAAQGERIKIILSWLHHPTGTIPNPTATSVSNFNLVIKNSQGSEVIASRSTVQNNEFVIFDATESGTHTYTVEVDPISIVTEFQHPFVLASSKSLSAPCPSFPGSGTWTISKTCIITGTVNVPNNLDVRVTNESDLVVLDGATLNIDFNNKHLEIIDGSRVIIKDGGKIT